MKFNNFLVILFLLISCRSSVDANKKPDWEIAGWILVWHDEFEGRYIDTSKWEHEVNAWGGGNNELQYYTNRRENSFIRDGKLVIRAIKETYTGPEGTREYTSARLRTFHKCDWKYGRFDIRAKLPEGKGLWPAIWMLPTDEVYGGWPASGEIDIMECLGQNPRKIYGTIHFGGPGNQHVYTGSSFELQKASFSEDFHVFTLIWDSTKIEWYVDGIQYYSTSKWFTINGNYPAPFDQRFYLILNLAVGGNWPGPPDETTIFPQEMIVDYVRVYQKNR
jgi:beta-glucanase (GH16 family)